MGLFEWMKKLRRKYPVTIGVIEEREGGYHISFDKAGRVTQGGVEQFTYLKSKTNTEPIPRSNIMSKGKGGFAFVLKQADGLYVPFDIKVTKGSNKIKVPDLDAKGKKQKDEEGNLKMKEVSVPVTEAEIKDLKAKIMQKDLWRRKRHGEILARHYKQKWYEKPLFSFILMTGVCIIVTFVMGLLYVQIGQEIVKAAVQGIQGVLSGLSPPAW